MFIITHLLASVLCFVDILHAVTLQEAITGVSTTLPTTGGGVSTIEPFIFTYLYNPNLKFLLYGIAILIIAVSGAEMVISQSDDTIAKARRAFLGSATGLIAFMLAPVIKNALFGNTEDITTAPQAAGAALNLEIFGIVDYFAMLLAAIAVLMIIISGIRAILEFGSGEGLGHLRRTVFGVIFGMTIIGIRFVVLKSFYFDRDTNTFGGEATSLIDRIVGIVQQFLSFIGIVAIAIIVYAGVLMVVNLGNEEQFKKGRDLIGRVAIGFIIILASKAIIAGVYNGFA